MAKKLKVLGAGSPIVDILVNVGEAYVASIPGEKGGMELVSSDALETLLGNSGAVPVKAAGGSAGNTIFGLARLGMPTAFLGKVGADVDGDFYRSQFKSFGGDTASFRVSETVHTGRCLSLVTPDSERTMRTDLGAAATLELDEVTPEMFAGVTHVHIEGYLLFAEPLFNKIITTAKAAGCTTSVDIASFEIVRIHRGQFPQILSEYVDIVFANEDESREFCGSDNPDDGIAALGQYCETAVVKLGAEGSIIKHGDEIVRVKADKVKAVDTTGAGDLWHAGFLYGFLNGKDLATCGRFGSMLGAAVVQVMGAAIPDEKWDEIRKQLA